MAALPAGLRLEVAARTALTPDVVRIDLARADGGVLPPFTAGAHIDVAIDEGIVRQYSLCNDPAERHRYRIAILRDPQSRGGSARVHDAFLPGRPVIVGAPRNLFALAEGADRHILIGGGIGITPIMAMAMALKAGGARYALHYCSRDPAAAAFAEDVAALAGQHHFSRVPGSPRFDPAEVLGPPDPAAHAYVCGPPGFMAAVEDAARRQGWPETNLHREAFAAAEPADQPGDRPFAISLLRSGRMLAVPPGSSVAAILADAGIEIPLSCEQGICGTCLIGVVAGTPDHRDSYLTDDEHAAGDQFTPCCSRSLTPVLVLNM